MLYCVGNSNRAFCSVIFNKNIVANGYKFIGQIIVPWVVLKSIIADRSNAVRNCYTRKTAATIERKIADRGYAVGDCYSD